MCIDAPMCRDAGGEEILHRDRGRDFFFLSSFCLFSVLEEESKHLSMKAYHESSEQVGGEPPRLLYVQATHSPRSCHPCPFLLLH